jgi:lipopolysaccharide export system permease protein
VGILDRFLIRIFLKYLLVAWIFMGGLFLFQAMFTDLYNHSFPLEQIIFYYAYEIPHILVQMMAPACLLATALMGIQLSRSAELTALFSLGFSLAQVGKNLIGISIIMSGVSLFCHDKVLPKFYRKRATYYWTEIKKNAQFLLDVKSEKIWYRSDDYIYNLKFFDKMKQTIWGIKIYALPGLNGAPKEKSLSDFAMTRLVQAKKAVFTEAGWILCEGMTIDFPKPQKRAKKSGKLQVGGGFPVVSPFEQLKVDLGQTPEQFQESEKEVDGLNFRQLKRYLQQLKDVGLDSSAVQVKYLSRFSMSVLPVLMVIVAMPFSFSVRRKSAAGLQIGVCLLLTLLYWIAYSLCLSLGMKGYLHAMWAAWLPSLVFAFMGIMLTLQKKFF